MEFHIDRARFLVGPWRFGFEFQMDAFVRLDAHGQDVGSEADPRILAEHAVRRAFELHHDFADFAAHRLARTQIEGHALPAPVIDIQFECGVGWRLGVVGDTARGAVARVLAAQRIAQLNRPDGAQHFDLFVTQRVRVERGGRLHRHQGQQLQQMILEHIA